MKKPKAPPETPTEAAARARQAQDLAATDVQENLRKRALMRGRLGSRSLLSGTASGILEDALGGPSPSGERRGRSDSSAPAGLGGGLAGAAAASGISIPVNSGSSASASLARGFAMRGQRP